MLPCLPCPCAAGAHEEARLRRPHRHHRGIGGPSCGALLTVSASGSPRHKVASHYPYSKRQNIRAMETHKAVRSPNFAGCRRGACCSAQTARCHSAQSGNLPTCTPPPPQTRFPTELTNVSHAPCIWLCTMNPAPGIASEKFPPLLLVRRSPIRPHFFCCSAPHPAA